VPKILNPQNPYKVVQNIFGRRCRNRKYCIHR